MYKSKCIGDESLNRDMDISLRIFLTDWLGIGISSIQHRLPWQNQTTTKHPYIQLFLHPVMPHHSPYTTQYAHFVPIYKGGLFKVNKQAYMAYTNTWGLTSSSDVLDDNELLDSRTWCSPNFTSSAPLTHGWKLTNPVRKDRINDV